MHKALRSHNEEQFRSRAVQRYCAIDIDHWTNTTPKISLNPEVLRIFPHVSGHLLPEHFANSSSD